MRYVSLLHRIVMFLLGIVGWCNAFYFLTHPSNIIDSVYCYSLGRILILPGFVIIVGIAIVSSTEFILGKTHWNALLYAIFVLVALYFHPFLGTSPARDACGCIPDHMVYERISDWSFMRWGTIWAGFAIAFAALNALSRRMRLRILNRHQ